MFPVGSSSGSSRDSRMSISSQDSVYHSSDTDSDVSHVIMVTISLDIAEKYHNLNRTQFSFPSFLSREDKFWKVLPSDQKCSVLTNFKKLRNKIFALNNIYVHT